MKKKKLIIILSIYRGIRYHCRRIFDFILSWCLYESQTKSYACRFQNLWWRFPNCCNIR